MTNEKCHEGGMKTLETDRLLMRRLVATDLDELYALYRDPEIRRYFPEGTLTRAETQEELEWFRLSPAAE